MSVLRSPEHSSCRATALIYESKRLLMVPMLHHHRSLHFQRLSSEEKANLEYAALESEGIQSGRDVATTCCIPPEDM
jgi:hypothetical protein